MRHVPQSPYLRALGQDRGLLHPGLSDYFAAVPAGRVGIGEGVFRRAGTPRRWLWPLYRLLQPYGVVLAGWHEDVPFQVRNRTIAGKAIGRRTFLLPDGAWTMKDAVTARPNGIVVDQLGEPTMVAAWFRIAVDEGALRLRSTSIGVRLGGFRMRIPCWIAPVIRLRESFDDEAGRQHVELTVDVPLIGRVYEYDGSFTYRVDHDVASRIEDDDGQPRRRAPSTAEDS